MMDEINEMNLPESEEAPKKKGFSMSALYDCLEIFCLSVVLVIMIFTFVGRMATVVGESMENTLQNGDRILVSSFFYTPECGDIVVIQKESGYYDDQLLIKRVIAAGGQTVKFDFEEWTVTVDGKTMDEEGGHLIEYGSTKPYNGKPKIKMLSFKSLSEEMLKTQPIKILFYDSDSKILLAIECILNE